MLAAHRHDPTQNYLLVAQNRPVPEARVCESHAVIKGDTDRLPSFSRTIVRHFS
ncbi:MAG TPA: hypothetical protein VN664_11350 [Burkholderiales bacterium]|nr:hypothetical protein [Burkholderiales bacterium]